MATMRRATVAAGGIYIDTYDLSSKHGKYRAHFKRDGKNTTVYLDHMTTDTFSVAAGSVLSGEKDEALEDKKKREEYEKDEDETVKMESDESTERDEDEDEREEFSKDEDDAPDFVKEGELLFRHRMGPGCSHGRGES